MRLGHRRRPHGKRPRGRGVCDGAVLAQLPGTHAGQLAFAGQGAPDADWWNPPRGPWPREAPGFSSRSAARHAAPRNVPERTGQSGADQGHLSLRPCGAGDCPRDAALGLDDASLLPAVTPMATLVGAMARLAEGHALWGAPDLKSSRRTVPWRDPDRRSGSRQSAPLGRRQGPLRRGSRHRAWTGPLSGTTNGTRANRTTCARPCGGTRRPARGPAPVSSG